MRRIALHRSQTDSGAELSLPAVTYGCWRLADDPAGTEPAIVQKKVETCLEHGISAFDHADIYGDYRCEALFGDLLAQQPQLREQIQLISKTDIALVSASRPEHRVKHYDTSARHIEESVERSLRNLRAETLDLLLLHRPDPLMDADETAHALQALFESGKVTHFGVSNFPSSQFELLQARLDLPLVTNQIELSLLEHAACTNGTLDFLAQHRIAPMAWSPLGGGRLFTGSSDRIRGVRSVLDALAVERELEVSDRSRMQLALAWILRLPSQPIVVIGTNKSQRIAASAEASEIELSRQEWFRLYEAALGQEVP